MPVQPVVGLMVPSFVQIMAACTHQQRLAYDARNLASSSSWVLSVPVQIMRWQGHVIPR